ncbi:MAG: DMT family transporter [Deferrisomatales bacterium]|nr:DMT family transporter [Deferrisomatales bacterium]
MSPGYPGRLVSRAVLLAGVLAISTAAVLIRLCDAPSLVIAAYRLGIASLVVVPVELVRTRGLPSRRDLGWCVLSGLFLSAHFAAWISSLAYTSVASSVVLVTTNPLFVGLFSWWVLREPPGRRTAAGIALGMVGATAIGWGDFRGGAAPLLGDALALLGALAASAYLLTGRVARRRLATHTYVAWTYGCCALFLCAATVAAGLPLGPYPPETLGYLVLLALVPQLVGHTAINWSLAHLTAPTVSVAILGEVVGASLLAWWVLGEVPGLTTVAGGALICTGIVLALGRGETAAVARADIPGPAKP